VRPADRPRLGRLRVGVRDHPGGGCARRARADRAERDGGDHGGGGWCRGRGGPSSPPRRRGRPGGARRRHRPPPPPPRPPATPASRPRRPRGPRARPRFARGERARASLAWAERQLRERGGELIVIARFIPAGRTAVTLSAGILRYPYRRFIVFDAAAALFWAL